MALLEHPTNGFKRLRAGNALNDEAGSAITVALPHRPQHRRVLGAQFRPQLDGERRQLKARIVDKDGTAAGLELKTRFTDSGVEAGRCLAAPDQASGEIGDVGVDRRASLLF